MDLPAVVPHTAAPPLETAQRFTAFAACIVGLTLTALLATALPLPWSLVPWAVTLVLLAGVGVFGQPLWLEMRHGALGLDLRRLQIYHLDETYTLQRRGYRRWINFVLRMVQPAPPPPRYTVINGQTVDISGVAGRTSGAAQTVDVSARVVATAEAAGGRTARYDPGETQRLERFALPAPPDVPPKAHWMRQYLKPPGTSPSWRTCRKNMSEAEWRASIAALLAIGELEDLGKNRGYRWR